MVWLAAHMPFAAAAEAFERLAGRAVPTDAIWDETQRHGDRLQQHLARQQAAVAVERVSLPPVGADHRPLGVSLDGGKMNIRGEGWKELKAGTVFEVVARPEKDAQTGEWVERVHAVNMTYRAVLGDNEAFAPALWALAVERQVPQAADVTVTADGADWIWNLVADYFPDSVQVVDWYHATEYLARAAEALFPNDTDAGRRWLAQRRDDLFAGQIHKIIEPLERAGLTTQAEYFRNHTRHMQYQEFHESARSARAPSKAASSASSTAWLVPACVGRARPPSACSSCAPPSCRAPSTNSGPTPQTDHQPAMHPVFREHRRCHTLEV
jgi:hypothetical protein